MIPFGDTLEALVESLTAAAAPGLVVESATMDVPLEGRVVRVDGTPTFFASVPHTRWRSGVLPAVHVAHLRIVEGEE
jgi:hypothetical protein